MKKLLNLYKKLIPEYSRLWLPLAAVWNLLSYYGARLIAHKLPHRIISMRADAHIPFIPWTVTIYLFSFIFWTVNYALAARRDEKRARRFFCADFLTRCVCFILFIALPTTNVRPEHSGAGIWERIVSLLYAVDMPDNLFPSIHCISSLLSAVGIASDKRVPSGYRVFSFAAMLAIFVSTLTTKQHLLADVISGAGLALLCYFAAGNEKLSSAYKKMTDKIKIRGLQ